MGLARTVPALMVLAALAAASQAGELVVIASTDPAVKIGTVIDGKQSMQVVGDASVVLISSAGKRISLAGPYKGAPQPTASPSDNRLVQSLSQLITQHADTPEKLAAFRGTGKPPPAERFDIWGIDIAHAGSYCLPANEIAMLWWDDAHAGAVVSLSGPAGNARELRIRWPNAHRQMPWPRDLSLADGASYVVRFRATDAGIALTTREMPPLDTNAARAAWMAEHGCTRQALKIVDAIARNELEPRS